MSIILFELSLQVVLASALVIISLQVSDKYALFMLPVVIRYIERDAKLRDRLRKQLTCLSQIVLNYSKFLK